MLLDTHIWLWFAQGDAGRLLPSSVKVLEEARRNKGLWISAISVWEIGVHQAKGRIQISQPLRDWVRNALAVPGINLIPLDADIAAESTLFPGTPHGDPADRFLIATARTKGLVLATRDHVILDYGKAGHVHAAKL